MIDTIKHRLAPAGCREISNGSLINVMLDVMEENLDNRGTPQKMKDTLPSTKPFLRDGGSY